MERKYYLRGLGLGIVVTAIIMGMMLSGKEKMSDEDVIARAKELGMVEDTVLSDSINDAKAEAAAAAEAEAAEEPEIETETTQTDVADPETETEKKTETETKPETEVQNEPAVEDEDASEPDDSLKDSKQTDSTKNDTSVNSKTDTAANKVINTEPKTITVGSGDGSYTVAKKLADAGVVSSAQSYDEYLCSNGYDKKLRTGTFTIPANATEEQIAKIVTGPSD
jgi:type IV secretory pathway VirB10-like protein